MPKSIVSAAVVLVFAASVAARDVEEGGVVDRAAARAIARLHEMGATLVLRSGKVYDPQQAILVGPADVRKVEFPQWRPVAGSAGELRERVGNDDLMLLRPLSAIEEVVVRKSCVTDAGLAYLAHLKKLRALDLSDGTLTDAALPAIAELAGLERLNLAGNRLARPDWAILARLERLSDLHLAGNNLGDNALARIGGLKSLRRLYLANNGLTDTAIGHLAALKELETLDLSNNDLVGRGLGALLASGRLKTLELADCPIGREALPIAIRLHGGGGPLLLDGRNITVAEVLRESREPITGLTAQVLLSGERHGPSRPFVYLWSELGCSFGIAAAGGDKDLEALGRYAGIRRVEIHNWPISDDGLAALAKLPKLSKLEIVTTGVVTDKGIRALGGLPALESLHLDGIDLRGDALKPLADLPRLRALTLADGRIKGSNLAHLGRSTTLTSLCLKDLDIDGPGFEQLGALRQLQRLEVPGAELSDREFAAIGRMRALKYLNLSHTNTSDAALEHLTGLAKLSSLDLERTTVTAEGLRHLRKCRELWLDCTATGVGDDDAQALADDFGWTFYGGCSCGCLDITPRKAGK